MRFIRLIIIALIGLLLCSCAFNYHDPPPDPFHTVSKDTVAEDSNPPIVIFIHGAGKGETDVFPQLIGTSLVRFEYPWLNGTEWNGSLFLKEFLQFKKEHPHNRIILVAHSYGCCVVMDAIGKDAADSFRDIPLVMLAPVLIGTEGAMNRDGPVCQFFMKLFSYLPCEKCQDYREAAKSEDPEGPIIQNLLAALPNLEKRVSKLEIFMSGDDKYVPKKDSPEILVKNFGILESNRNTHLLMSDGSENPHEDIITREEILIAVGKLTKGISGENLVSQN